MSPEPLENEPPLTSLRDRLIDFIMSTPVLYVLAITIWGSTWYGIKLQLGVVAPEISIAYRFTLAGIVLLAWGAFHKKKLKFSWDAHKYFATLGFCLFSLSYFCAYYAGGLITSGLNAVLFSTIVFFNIFNSKLFLKKEISYLTIIGAIIGFGGLCLVFLPEILGFNASSLSSLMGMGFAVFGGFLGSLGNMISSKLQSMNVSVLQGNAYSMTYGGIFSLIMALILGKSIAFDPSVTYVGSLLYLSLIGSIISFGCYLTVLGRVGADKAALPMVMIPVVALIISEFFEDYHWSPYAALGIFLMLFGNLAVTTKGKREALKKLLRKKTS